MGALSTRPLIIDRLATQGMIPLVTIYSTFLQRAYDQVIHDTAIQNLPVRFVLDRGGLVGADGPTHHGAFDLSYLRLIPNFVVMAPKDENELRHMVKTLVDYDSGPIALRFPRGAGTGVAMDDTLQALEIGKGEMVREGTDVIYIAIGAMVDTANQAADELARQGISTGVMNARFVKPLDTDLIDAICATDAYIITVEDNAILGGFGSAITEYMVEAGHDTARLKTLGIPDKFIEHGGREQLMSDIGLDADGLVKAALEGLDAHDGVVNPAAG